MTSPLWVQSSYPVGERLDNPESYPVAFSRDGEVFYRGSDNFYRWWPLGLAKSIAQNFARKGWTDLSEPLSAAIAEAEAYHMEPA